MSLSIILPPGFTTFHSALVLQFLEDRPRFEAREWPQVFEAFDLLHTAQLQTPEFTITFRALYHQQCEARHALVFIRQLQEMVSLEIESVQLQAVVARALVQELNQKGFVQRKVPESRLLLAYFLYWWRSFARGYAFEVWVLRNLRASGIEVQAHDLSDPISRLSAYDVEILGFRGDIKTSTYFLKTVRDRGLRHDFYITQVSGLTLVVMLKEAFWELINGDTIPAAISQVVSIFPKAARLHLPSGELVVLEYEDWKARVRAKQKEQ
jgi:hypothetical protein